MRKISFSLNEKSIDAAISKIEAHGKTINGKCELLVERLARYGQYVARVGFTNAIYEGINDVSLNVQKVPDGYMITASGKNVCFIEFGTGVEATSPHGGEFGFVPGSWSIDHAQAFINNGFWFYNGKKLTGTPANNCMYNARKEIEAEIKTFAREVFKWSIFKKW